jgi:hypothetical protein
VAPFICDRRAGGIRHRGIEGANVARNRLDVAADPRSRFGFLALVCMRRGPGRAGERAVETSR